MNRHRECVRERTLLLKTEINMFSGDRLAGLRGVATRGGGCWPRALVADDLDGAIEEEEEDEPACDDCCRCCWIRCLASEGSATTT